eukprot:15336054-Ditylum_brightwellii.AAC.1
MVQQPACYSGRKTWREWVLVVVARDHGLLDTTVVLQVVSESIAIVTVSSDSGNYDRRKAKAEIIVHHVAGGEQWKSVAFL